MQTHYAITLKIVPLADAADAVKRIQTEAAAGRKANGSVDLLWVNGENFRTLKEANLLQNRMGAVVAKLALCRYP
ncbi:thiamine transport system substrate-binding protein [Enterobacter asburiae]|uniref:Thiamine transport system substrate-binding protein n=1 Tax=Enterobacter asburiae TaxID=61645 RepID=A0A376F8J9_ENTAS|nr:thiamine transport system substrate-binding protein [Enterobacter asburiae]